MIIWWGLEEPVAAFVALLGGSLMIGLWDIQMGAERSDKVPQNSAEFGEKVSDAAMQDITIGHTDVEVTGIDEFEELERKLRLSNKRIRSIQDEQCDDDILTDI